MIDFRTRQHLLAGLLLALATAVCFHQLVLNPGDLLVGPQRGGQNDLTAHTLAARSYPQHTLARFGQLPLWNPYGLSGTAWLGNPQSALFYPPNWLFLCCDAAALVSWLLVGHHWFAGLGTYLLARRYGLRLSSSVMAGIAFLGAPYLIAQTGEGHTPQVCLIAWVPWAFLAYERLRAGRRGGIPLTALVLALAFFCGHVQEAFYLVLILSAFVVAQAGAAVVRRFRMGVEEFVRIPEAEVSRLPLRVAPGRLLASWTLVGVLTIGLVAVELLPNWIYTRQAVRAEGLTVEQAGEISAGWANLAQLFNPRALGGPEDYSGPGEFYWETLCYFGIVPLMLAWFGAATGLRRYPIPHLIVLFVVAGAFALGPDTPVFGILHQYVPGVGMFRAPGRALFYCSFAVAMLAGFGFDALLALVNRPVTWLPQRCPRAVPAGLLAAAVAAFCLADLARYARQTLRTIPSGSIRDDSQIAEFLSSRQGGGRVLVSQDLLSDREGARHGIEKLQQYDPVPLIRYAIVSAALTPDRDPAVELTGFQSINLAAYHKPLLDLLGVRHAVVTGRRPMEREGWKAVAQGWVPEEFALRGSEPRRLPYTVYENGDPLPRAFVLGETAPLRTHEAIAERLGQFDPRQTVLVEQDVLPPGARQTFQPAAIVEYSPNRVRIEAELSAPGYLVLTDAFYSGWKAVVNGQPAAVQPANFAFRAVPLGAGRHEVTFHFTPPGAPFGLLLTLTTLALLIGHVVLSRMHRLHSDANQLPKDNRRRLHETSATERNDTKTAIPI